MIEVLPLGAGQDVGRSCILINFSLANRCVMLDCGMHMGHTETSLRFPDLSVLDPSLTNLTHLIDLVLISHFHLDHCGALPYLTEQCGYNGPVIMSEPTKDICPLLLEDYRQIMQDRVRQDQRDYDFFTSQDIEQCMKKVMVIRLNEPIIVNGLKVTAWYAGHVLGACMFLIESLTSGESVLYTGDFNSTADRHLGAYHIPSDYFPGKTLDLLITESTYAMTVRTTVKHQREQDLLSKIEQCVIQDHGKVLIPTFALGRAQELCMLVDQHWQRCNHLQRNVPVYLAGGLGQKALDIFKRHLAWTNEATQQRYNRQNNINPFDFMHIQPWQKHFLSSDVKEEEEEDSKEDAKPMVLFSSPGMLHSGLSLQVFTKWAQDERNLLIIPGYCVKGTVGAQVLAGHKQITVNENVPGRTPKIITVKCQVRNLSFSAHADARGILQLIQQLKPRNVVLVHGESQKMSQLERFIQREFSFEIKTFSPANGSICRVSSTKSNNNNGNKLITYPIVMNDQWMIQVRREIHLAAIQVSKLSIIDPKERLDLLSQSVIAQHKPDWDRACQIICPSITSELSSTSKSDSILRIPLAINQFQNNKKLECSWNAIQLALIQKLHPYANIERKGGDYQLQIGPYINIILEKGENTVPNLVIQWSELTMGQSLDNNLCSILLEETIIPILKSHIIKSE